MSNERTLRKIIDQQRAIMKTQALIIREIMSNLPDEWRSHPNVAQAIAVSDRVLAQLKDVDTLEEIPPNFGARL